MNFIYLRGGETTPNNIRLRTVVSDSQSVAPDVGSLAFTAFIASLAFTLGLQLVGYAPTVSQGTPLTPTTAALSLTGQAPVLGAGVIPTAGSLALTGQSSTLQLVMPGQAGAASLTGYSPTLIAGMGVMPDAGALVLSGKVSTVDATGGGASTALYQRVIRGNDATGADDWWVSYQA